MNQPDLFDEPWQAQAFAIAVRLSELGCFTWKEWAAALAAELAAAAERGEADDDGSEYYHHWLAALEGLVISKGLTDVAALFERREAWADAYRHTPHGQPVALRPGYRISYTYRQSPLHNVVRETEPSGKSEFRTATCSSVTAAAADAPTKAFPSCPSTSLRSNGKSAEFEGDFTSLCPDVLGPCPLANVVLLQFRGKSMWFHSINHPDDVNLVYDYVEGMLLAEEFIDPPDALASRMFDRYRS